MNEVISPSIEDTSPSIEITSPSMEKRSSSIEDTSPSAAKFIIARLRATAPETRLLMAFEMTAAAKLMARSRITAQYKDRPEREIVLRLGALWLDRGTMIRAFGWDPDKEGR